MAEDDVVTVEFQSRDEATAVANQYEEFVADSDDRRQATLRLSGDAPQDVLDRVTVEAADSRKAEAEKYGQMDLTDREKSRIDFTETSVPEARAAKAVAFGKGVSNWTDYFDETLTVDENRGVFESASGDEAGYGRSDMSEAEIDAKLSSGIRQFREQVNQAKRPALKGDEGAREFLADEAGSTTAAFEVGVTTREVGGGEFTVTDATGPDADKVKEINEERSKRALAIDNRRNATITTDPVEWADNPDRYDFPGVDNIQPEELHSQRSERSREMDENRTAERAPSVEAWARNPDEYDLPGVDTPLGGGADEVLEAEFDPDVLSREELRQREDAFFDEMERDAGLARAQARDIPLAPDEASGTGASNPYVDERKSREFGTVVQTRNPVPGEPNTVWPGDGPAEDEARLQTLAAENDPRSQDSDPGDVLSVDDTGQAALGGGTVDEESQAEFDLAPDVRDSQGQDTRMDVETGSLLADDRSDPSRGAGGGGMDTGDQATLGVDPDQAGLGDLGGDDEGDEYDPVSLGDGGGI